MPGGFPGGMPGGFPGGMPGGFPGGMPGGFPGGMPGGAPGGMPGGAPGGAGGMPAGMPDISALLSDPEIMKLMQVCMHKIENCLHAIKMFTNLTEVGLYTGTQYQHR